ncbi:MAG TPA: hypothetical protein VKP13_16355 [Nitrospira sp.]|nr:hypothetical protein [Nitrospira sp.]
MVAQACGCHRCGGMMVETYADLISPTEIGEAVILWRCVNCGDYLDQQIIQNRTAREEATCLAHGSAQHRAIPRHARPVTVQRQAQ